jgi:hypothetical protein
MFVIRAAAVALTLALASTWAFAEGAHDLEETMIESASTPAQHEALAQHFHGKAEEARKEAKRHLSMGKYYAGRKWATAASQSKHCQDLAANLESQAKLYDELAAGHESEAKQ